MPWHSLGEAFLNGKWLKLDATIDTEYAARKGRKYSQEFDGEHDIDSVEGPLIKNLESYKDYPKDVADWYEQMAKSRPPKDKPWYHVLVDKSPTITYVAERNIEEDSSKQPIFHPLVNNYFNRFEEGIYIVDVS